MCSINLNVVLLGCGSFNPPTVMHLRLFEIARDSLVRHGFNVLGGIMSPVHDGYRKSELVSAKDRRMMIKLALQSSDWVHLSDWESTQETWIPTRLCLQHHQNTINAVLNNKMPSPKKRQRREKHIWLTESISNANGPVQVMLLCGGDLLESFATPGLWKPDDLETIVGEHGVVVVSRVDMNPHKLIYESDLLTKYQSKIHIVMEWISNEVSSTRIRRALKRQESVKYLVPDSVINYIKQKSLYCSIENTTSKINVSLKDEGQPVTEEKMDKLNSN